MSVVIILILASLAVALLFLAGFIWSVCSGQYEDTLTPSMRMLLDEPVASESQTLRRVLARHATGIPTVAVKEKSSCIRLRFSTGMHVDGLHAKRSMSPSHESIPCGLKVRTHYGTAWFMMYQPWSILRSALLWPLVLPHLHEGMGQGQGRPHMPHAVHPGVTR